VCKTIINATVKKKLNNYGLTATYHSAVVNMLRIHLQALRNETPCEEDGQHQDIKAPAQPLSEKARIHSRQIIPTKKSNNYKHHKFENAEATQLNNNILKENQILNTYENVTRMAEKSHCNRRTAHGQAILA
jgi:hypothetical protein